MKRFLIVSMAVVAVGAMANMVTASPIPAPPLVPNVQGQSTLFGGAGVSFINVDWGVQDGCAQFGGPGAGSGCFAFVYQLENDSGTAALARDMIGFSIPFDTTKLFPVAVKAGYSPAFDLDVSVTVHNSGADASLLGETEPAGGQVDISPITLIDIQPPGGALLGGVSWQWGGPGSPVLPDTFETGVFWVLSSAPPVYGNGSALGVGGFSWSSEAPGGQPIPTNQVVSEPGTLLLLGLGLGALGVRFRRRREEN